MSYILDALQKSERQRQMGEVPQVHSVQDHYPADLPRRNPWVMVAVIAVVLNLAVGGWIWWQYQSTSKTTATAPGSPTMNAAPALAAAPSAPTPIPPRQQTDASAMAPSAASHAIRPAPDAANDMALDDKVVVFESIAPPTAPPTPAAQRFNDLVDISELPTRLRMAMLALTLNVHVYDEHPAQRFVMIDMKRYAEGHALPQGPVIEAITPDGVVLAYQGQRFLLRRN